MGGVAAVTQSVGSLHPDEFAILEDLHQHRLLSTEQLLALMPLALRCSNTRCKHVQARERRVCERCGRDLAKRLRWAQDCTLALERLGLISSVRARSSGRMKLHFLTATGLRAVVAAPRLEERRRLLTPTDAAGPLQAHTLAVNDVGVAFVAAARDRGDECTPLAWRHEVAHPTGRGSGRGAKGGEVVISDAVLSYTLLEAGDATMLTRFVEVDRATYQAETLVAKLRNYALLHAYRPDGAREEGWRRSYPQAFPQIIVALTGKRRPDLERRRDIVLAGAGADRRIQEATGPADRRTGFLVACVLLADLQAEGPFAPIFRRHTSPSAPVNWLGRA